MTFIAWWIGGNRDHTRGKAPEKRRHKFEAGAIQQQSAITRSCHLAQMRSDRINPTRQLYVGERLRLRTGVVQPRERKGVRPRRRVVPKSVQ